MPIHLVKHDSGCVSEGVSGEVNIDIDRLGKAEGPP